MYGAATCLVVPAASTRNQNAMQRHLFLSFGFVWPCCVLVCGHACSSRFRAGDQRLRYTSWVFVSNGIPLTCQLGIFFRQPTCQYSLPVYFERVSVLRSRLRVVAVKQCRSDRRSTAAGAKMTRCHSDANTWYTGLTANHDFPIRIEEH